MIFAKLKKRYSSMEEETRWSRVIIGGLIAITGMLSIHAMTKETIVTVTPFTLTEEAWLGEKSASKSYKEAWGLAFAMLFGNITPATVDFVKTRTGPFLSPKIFSEVMDILEVQSKQIKEDRVSMRFEPRHVEYEIGTDKIFVYGYSYVKGADSKETRSDRTYEFRIKISKYAPFLDHIDTYVGRPRTKTIEGNIRRKEEQQQLREDKENRIKEAQEHDMESKQDADDAF